MSRRAWLGASMVTLGLGSYLGWKLQDKDKKIYLPGQTTHGHYQIELQCDACHTETDSVPSDACLDCHAQELDRADDSHPPSKFLDPRNASLVDKLDARECITCHVEHRPVLTAQMGVTLPGDYCFYCHEDIGEDRPTHQGLDHDSCQAGGCHNFHDNLALHEDFLEAHLDEPWLREPALVPVRAPVVPSKEALSTSDADAPARWLQDQNLLSGWEHSAHAVSGVNCADCHGAEASFAKRPTWDVCRECHEDETTGFTAGHHGMRLAEGLPPMTPRDARLPMKADARDRRLDCGSCHGAHDYDTRRAAVEACLDCHDDQHSRAYETSTHAALFRAELRGQAPQGTGVSCATCHMPRFATRAGSEELKVQHNQNDNLRPNEKMIRSVCIHCHGVDFSLDALASAALAKTNYMGRPGEHVASMDWVKQRRAERTGGSDQQMNKESKE